MKNTIAFLVSTSIPSILNSLNNDKSIIYELKKKKRKNLYFRLIKLCKYK